MSITPNQYYSAIERPLTMQLPYENATDLALSFNVNSGTTIDVDWGDGITVTLPADGTYQFKNFGTPTTGVVTVYHSEKLSSYENLAAYPFFKHSVSVFKQATGLARFYAHGEITGDMSLIPKSVHNFIVGGNGVFTGTGDDIQPLMQSFQCLSTNNTFTATSFQLQPLSALLQYRVLGKSIFSGDINPLPAGLVILSLKNTGTPLHEISYTPGRTWHSNMRVVELMPKSGYGMTTEEVDALLIDLAATTWTNEKIINVAGNNAPRSIASDEAKATLEAMGVTVMVNEPVTYYVRPAGSTYGTGDGTSYANAWSGYADINMTAIQGNRLAVCGTHTEAFTFDGINFQMIGDDINEAGVFNAGLSISDMVTIQNATNFKARGITINNPNVTGLHFEDVDYYIESCYFDNSQNQGIQHYGVCNGYIKDCEFTNNVDDGISGHETATFTVDGGHFENNEAGINVIQDCNVTIINNPTFIGNVYDVWAANATTPESCSITATGCTFPNQVLASNLAKIVLNNCVASDVRSSASGSNKGYLDVNTSVIANIVPANNIVNINNSRLNDITSISAGGVINITNSYVKPVGVFDNFGNLKLLRTLFNGVDCTDHLIDNNAGSTFKAEHCIFINSPTNKYALSIRNTGSTGLPDAVIEALDGITITGSSNVGRGIYSQIALTAKNVIITDLDVAVTAAVSGQNITLENGCLFDNTTTANGSGLVIQNDMQNTYPLFTDAANENYTLGVGSDCIANGETLAETEGFDTVSWGDNTTPPTITTQTLSVFNIGGI